MGASIWGLGKPDPGWSSCCTAGFKTHVSPKPSPVSSWSSQQLSPNWIEGRNTDLGWFSCLQISPASATEQWEACLSTCCKLWLLDCEQLSLLSHFWGEGSKWDSSWRLATDSAQSREDLILLATEKLAMKALGESSQLLKGVKETGKNNNRRHHWLFTYSVKNELLLV